jgi:adhesin HecA-like repeat protein
LLEPTAARGAGYYNLGAFWRAPQAGAPSCSNISFVQVAPANSGGGNAPAVLGGPIWVNKLGGSVSLSANVSFDTAGQGMTLTSGTVLMSGHNLTINGQLTLDAGTTITQGGGTLSYGSLTNNGTIN